MKFVYWLPLLCCVPAFGNGPEAGVSRDLARTRAAEISDLRYHLFFELKPHEGTTAGHEEVRFKSKHSVALPIDFREGTLAKVVLNGRALGTSLENGHFVLPSIAVKPGENDLLIDFAARIAPAGKAITRFEDKDDRSEYIYTLFVPMDASMAFPCFDQPDLKGRFTLELTAPRTWTVISNSAVVETGLKAQGQHFVFAETRPISTYLFAFAAGPFARVHVTAGNAECVRAPVSVGARSTGSTPDSERRGTGHGVSVAVLRSTVSVPEI